MPLHYLALTPFQISALRQSNYRYPMIGILFQSSQQKDERIET